MLIKVEDLQVEDEILVSSNSKLRYLRVIRPPRLRKKPSRYGNYTSAWCSSKIETIVHKRNYGAGGGNYTWKERIKHCAPINEHNVEKYENLNKRSIWLVRRDKI